jgi:hypothetical protein
MVFIKPAEGRVLIFKFLVSVLLAAEPAPTIWDTFRDMGFGIFCFFVLVG